MDSTVKIYLRRSFNELSAAKLLFAISHDREKKVEFHIEEEMTFYSAVISHSYYAIFFAVKSILLTKGIKTEMPDIHKKTYEVFKEEFVNSGLLDAQLLKIY